MAFIDNQTITVDAILTQKGRELLAQNGDLNITSFALADDEIDYTLYQPNHPNGSALFLFQTLSPAILLFLLQPILLIT